MYSSVLQKATVYRYGSNIKLSIGVSRSMKRIGWVSLDPAGKPDIRDSAELLLAIPDNSCKTIVASAIFEHLNYTGQGYMRIQKAIRILKLWKRKLKKRGYVYLALPDIDFLLKGISKHRKNFWAEDGYDWVGSLFGYMDTKYNVHSILLNYSCIKYCLEKAGFKDVKKVKDPKVFIKFYNHSAFNEGILNVSAHV